MANVSIRNVRMILVSSVRLATNYSCFVEYWVSSIAGAVKE
jgi:hypothetical protein